MQHYYDVSVEWIGGRKGIMSSEEVETSMEVATPPQFPKGVEGSWSPEHLYVAAINSCFMTTFLAIAENSKLEFSPFNSKAVGKLEMIEGKYLMTDVIIMPTVFITHEEDAEKALKVLQKAEAACLISNSVRSKVTMDSLIQMAGKLQPVK